MFAIVISPASSSTIALDAIALDAAAVDVILQGSAFQPLHQPRSLRLSTINQTNHPPTTIADERTDIKLLSVIYSTMLSCRVVGVLATRPGSSSQVRPSNSRPPAFGVLPPHCLKKNTTPASWCRSRRSRIHTALTGRYRGRCRHCRSHPADSVMSQTRQPSQQRLGARNCRCPNTIRN